MNATLRDKPIAHVQCLPLLPLSVISKKEGGRKRRGCAPQARHSLSHNAAAGGASAERAESVESTESEESVETGKAGPAQSALRRGLKDNEREIGGRIGEKRRRGGRRGCAPQARMRKGGCGGVPDTVRQSCSPPPRRPTACGTCAAAPRLNTTHELERRWSEDDKGGLAIRQDNRDKFAA